MRCHMLMIVVALAALGCSDIAQVGENDAKPSSEAIAKNMEASQPVAATNLTSPTVATTQAHSALNQEKLSTKSFDILFADGQTALDDGDNDAALTAFAKALEIDPQSAAATNSRGVTYLRMNKLGPALSDFNKAIELAPNVSKFYGNRALVYCDKDEYTRAIADLTKAIQLEPKSAQWYRERGKVYVFMEDNRLAEKDFDAAKQLDGPMPLQFQAKDLTERHNPFRDTSAKVPEALPRQASRKPLSDADAKERARLLADLTETQMKTAKALQDSDAQIKLAQQKDADLCKHINTLANAKRRTAQTDKTLRELNHTLGATRAKIKSLQQTNAVQVDAFEQRRREIIATYPLPDEVPPTQHGTRWLTQDEYAKVLEQEKAVEQQKSDQGKATEQQKSFRVNGQRLADWVWQALAKNYEFKAASVNVVLISQGRVRFVNPDPKQVYSLRPDKTEVELGAMSRNSERDDSYGYEIDYVNGLGQVIRKNGYVEVGYDNSGTAYLLGVMVPFLENPLDGQLAATRSSLDKALQRAFGG